tara:strand:- start:1900 stop:3051 length:1152 start_codon:yes stop_codon:yes gene_type:complete
MINYGSHYIDKKDLALVVSALKSKSLTTGTYVDNFEKNLNQYFGCKDSAVVSSGTAALHIAGIVLNWKKGDIVITAPNTFVATLNTILYSGATPDLVDIQMNSYSIDLNLLEKRIIYYKNKNKKVKCVIAVDYAGHPCDWKGLKYLSKKYGFQLVNDNCHAMGSKYEGRLDYAAKFADIVTHSYHPVKNFTTGEGGAILSNNSQYIKKAKILRSHGLIYNNKKNSSRYYDLKTLGYNYRLTDFQCALGISQLKKLPKFIEKRRSISKVYDNSFQKIEFMKVIDEKKNDYSANHLYPLLINFKELKVSKKQFFLRMLKKKIRLQTHYMPLHFHSYYKKNFKFANRKYPISELFYDREVSLPIYYGLSSKDTEKVIIKIFETLKE